MDSYKLKIRRNDYDNYCKVGTVWSFGLPPALAPVYGPHYQVIREIKIGRYSILVMKKYSSNDS